MNLPNPKDAIHKAWLYRLLTAIYDNQILANSLYFKGGTCAAMLDYLDRFSIDLDFDYVAKKQGLSLVSMNLEQVFKKLGLEIKDKSKKIPQYFLKYPVSQSNIRNTIKIDVTMPPPKSNKYTAIRFNEIDRIITCQTIETMFANKLVALIDRWEKNNSIAGRDLYDIHHFFMKGFRYDKKVIVERRKQKLDKFLSELIVFVEKRINNKVINQDLNSLLPYKDFKKNRKILKKETLMLLKDELKRVKKTKP